MNVFDFDKTIYYTDSTAQFYFFVLKRNPQLWLRSLKVFLGLGLCKLGIWTIGRFKSMFYQNFVPYINLECEVKAFWQQEKSGIKKWYLKMKQPSDVISTASPRFLVEPVTKELGVNLIASEVDPSTGKLLSANNRDREKVRRFRKEYPGKTIDKFYSDSMADRPLAQIAKQAFLVQRDEISNWPR